MTRRVQTLLYPSGTQNFGEVGITMPPSLREHLKDILSFKPSGVPSMEGTAVYRAMTDFMIESTNKNICAIEQYFQRAKGFFFLRTYVPMDRAAETVEFLKDQLSGHPCMKTLVPTNMRGTIDAHRPLTSEAEKLVAGEASGWFDLDTPAMTLLDLEQAWKMARLFNLEDVPHVDENLDFIVQQGPLSKSQKQLSVLAKAWGREISAEMNGVVYTARPWKEMCEPAPGAQL